MKRVTEKWLIGVDLGGTTTKMALINPFGDLLVKWEIPTDVTSEGKNIVANIARAIDEMLLVQKLTKKDIYGVGIGAPGPIDLETGEVFEAINLGWRNAYPLKEMFEEKYTFSVVIDNDANCAALGELWQGAGKGASDLVCITLGTGVGGGVIANGRIVHGTSCAAGEIGHMIAIPEGGTPCNCGKSGCLETIASGTGIVRLAEEMATARNFGMLKKIKQKNGAILAKDVFDAARDGDQVAEKVIEKVAFHLGLALANIANTLNPEKVVIGGGVSRASEILLHPVRKKFHQFAFPRVSKSTSVVLASLGNDAGVFGAAWLIKNALENNHRH